MTAPHVGLPPDENGVVWADRTPGLPAIPDFNLMTPAAVDRYLARETERRENRDRYTDLHESMDSLRDDDPEEEDGEDD